MPKKKVPQRIPKVQGGGGSRPFGKNPNLSRFFLQMASLTELDFFTSNTEGLNDNLFYFIS